MGQKKGSIVVFVMSAMLNPVFAPMALALGALHFSRMKFLLLCVAGNVVKAAVVAYIGYIGLGTMLAHSVCDRASGGAAINNIVQSCIYALFGTNFWIGAQVKDQIKMLETRLPEEFRQGKWTIWVAGMGKLLFS